MRIRFIATFLFSLLLLPALLHADITGDVQVVGYDQSFRPGTWTPLVVRIRPDTGTSGTYQIQVEQKDADQDLVTFTRTIALTASANPSGITDQRFITYFLPQGVSTIAGLGLEISRLDDLNSQLKVFIADEKGNRLAQLPVKSSLASLEPGHPGDIMRRGTKLVLYVRDLTSSPPRRDLTPNTGDLLGVNEDIRIVELNARALPTSALAYESVDAVVWASGAPPDQSNTSEVPQYRALRQWIGAGGRLVIMQHPEWRRTAAWGELLPVTFPKLGEFQGIVQRPDLEKLVEIAVPTGVSGGNELLVPWRTLRGPHNYGLALPKPGTLVEESLHWDTTLPANAGLPRISTWLARMPVGAGCVTYVAQDLGSPLLSPTTPAPGWPRIWARILDYRYQPLVATKKDLDSDKTEVTALFAGKNAWELGRGISKQMELTSRVGALIGVSIMFFLIYWVAAGPGSWLVLRLRKKQDWSWFAFAAVSGAATLLTLLVVRLVLRGSPELAHFTLVRVAQGEPAYVNTRMGLYIPRDGNQHLSLPPGNGDYASALAPYALHTFHAGSTDDSPSYRRYEVPVFDTAGAAIEAAGSKNGEGIAIDVPYRSTAKQLQFTWRGELKSAIAGKAALAASPSILTGKLTNTTGRNLRNVMLAFRAPHNFFGGQDFVLYLPSWKDGEQVSLDTLTNTRTAPSFDAPKGDGTNYSLDSGIPLWATLGNGDAPWDRWFKGYLRAAGMMGSDNPRDDTHEAHPRTYVLLSLYDRLPFYRNVRDTFDRAETLRINSRFLDTSAAVSAGSIAIIAQDDASPLPVPLSVNGDATPGTGTTLSQFILPLDRSKDTPLDDEAPDPPPTRRPVTPDAPPTLMPVPNQ